MNTRVCVVMAGGSGERFWPLSRAGKPKQLLKLTHPSMTMLEEAVDRARPLFGEDQVYIATSSALREPILESQTVPQGHVFSEPARRNTLGAQCWIVASLLAKDMRDVTLAIVTSDHKIGEPDDFRACLRDSMDVAEQEGGIVTIGIQPTRPETGYGYIEIDSDSRVDGPATRDAFRAKAFREKPSEETAESFLEAGNFVWNSGMFFYTINSFLKAVEATQPLAYGITLAISNAFKEGDDEEAKRLFEMLPNVSIDYAVMERATDVFVLRAKFPWDDVGAWDAMERSRDQDPKGNVVEGRVLIAESHNCIVLGLNSDLTVGVLGLKDMVVVVSENAVLVCHKSDVQRVRLLAQLDEKTS